MNSIHVALEGVIKEQRMIFRVDRQPCQKGKRRKAKVKQESRDRASRHVLNAHTHKCPGLGSKLCKKIYVMISILHTHTEYPGAQQDKPALVVPGLFDYWDEMSGNLPWGTIERMCVCLLIQAHLQVHICTYTCHLFRSIPKRKP